MIARMTRWEFEPTPEAIERITIRNRDGVLPAASALPGFQGFFWFVDREHGKALTLTLWESEEAARGSDEAANRLRAQTAQNTAIVMTSVERYELAVHASLPATPIMEVSPA